MTSAWDRDEALRVAKLLRDMYLCTFDGSVVDDAAALLRAADAEIARLRALEDAAAQMAEALRRIEATGHGCENARECGLVAFAALATWDASRGDG